MKRRNNNMVLDSTRVRAIAPNGVVLTRTDLQPLQETVREIKATRGVR